MTDSYNNKIAAVYFTCANHYEELYMSIKSLSSIAADKIRTVYVYVDLEDKLSIHQQERLKEWYPIIFRETPAPMGWGGVRTLENELFGFIQIAKTLDPNDYIMNIDSDCVITSTDFLKNIDTYDLIGHKIEHQFIACWDTSIRSGLVDFQQGSCYFLRAGIVSSMLQHYMINRKSVIEEVSAKCCVTRSALPADVSINTIVKRINGSINYKQYISDNKCSVIHMELTKHDHWKQFAKFIGIKNIGNHVIEKKGQQ